MTMQARRIEDEPVRVLVRRQGAEERSAALERLWRDAAAARMLPGTPSRIRIQVGQRWRSPLVVETAHALARHLAAAVPGATIDVDDRAVADPRAAVPDPSRTWTVHGLGAAEVRVPHDWFEPFRLVTVTGAGPDPSSGLSAVLDAQAEPLAGLGNALPPVRLAYEAHRLFASDLIVACVTETPADPAAAVWLVGTSDVGVEMAIAEAAGADAAQLPYLRTMQRHEILPRLERSGDEPRLQGHLAPRWVVRLNGARARFDTSRQALVQDVVSVRRNLHRIPTAIQRRLALWRRKDE